MSFFPSSSTHNSFPDIDGICVEELCKLANSNIYACKFYSVCHVLFPLVVFYSPYFFLSMPSSRLTRSTKNDLQGNFYTGMMRRYCSLHFVSDMFSSIKQIFPSLCLCILFVCLIIEEAM